MAKIAFISALGGQGCSLSAVYTAKAAALADHPVTLADLGGFRGTLACMLGVDSEVSMNLSDVAGGQCPLEDALIDCGRNLRLLPSGRFSTDAVSPLSVEVRRIVEELAREGDVFADLPAGTLPDCGMAGCFDVFVICSLADSMSLTYAAALCRMIRKAASQTTRPCGSRLLLSDFTPSRMKSGGVTDIDACVDTVGARLIGVLPHDETALCAALSGQPPDEKSELMRYARDTAERIYGARVPLDSSKPFRLRI